MARGQIQLAQSPLQQIQGGQYNTIKLDKGWPIQYYAICYRLDNTIQCWGPADMDTLANTGTAK